MVTGFWGPHSRRGGLLRGGRHSREEAVVARRAPIPTLEIRLTFEPSHGSPTWVVQAYEQVVPIRHRTTSEGAESRPVRCEPLTQRAGRRQTFDATCRKEADIMNTTQVAMYARVSSDQPAEPQTIASQVAALRERVAAEGFVLPEAMQFLDEGYSGATLIRPALERLRDVIAAGAVDRVYVHS